jgi:hypothetical protein
VEIMFWTCSSSICDLPNNDAGSQTPSCHIYLFPNGVYFVDRVHLELELYCRRRPEESPGSQLP